MQAVLRHLAQIDGQCRTDTEAFQPHIFCPEKVFCVAVAYQIAFAGGSFYGFPQPPAALFNMKIIVV